MMDYFRLTSSLGVEEIDKIEKNLANGSLHPMKAKRMLAKNIVGTYHNANDAISAEEEFDKVFKNKENPDDIAIFEGDLPVNDNGSIYIPKLLAEAKLASGTTDARRLIDVGGVKIDGTPIPAKTYEIPEDVLRNTTIKVGKRKFIKIP